MSEISGAPRRVMVNLEDISPAEPYQVRKVLAKNVNEYATAMDQGAQFPPVKLGRVDGALVCLGGHHRIAAARRIGSPTIIADVYEVDHLEAVRIALEDNNTHGVKLDKQGRRRALNLFIKSGLHKLGKGKVMASRDLAVAIGGTVSHDTILRWMAEDNPDVHARMQRGRAKPKGSGEYDYRKANATRAKQAALDAIRACLAAARGTKSPRARGEIRAALLKAAAHVEKLGDYMPPKEDAQAPQWSDF